MDWALLFDFLTKLLDNCGDETSKLQAVRSPLRARAAVSRALRQQGFRGQELRKQREVVMARIDEASDDEVLEQIRGQQV